MIASRALDQADGRADWRVGHLYLRLNATALEVHRAFWAATMGGTLVGKPAHGSEAIAFGETLLFIHAGSPIGGTRGSTVNHIAFQVPRVSAMVAAMRAAGYSIVTTTEVPPHLATSIDDEVAYIGVLNLHVAFVIGPDDVKVEFVETPALRASIAPHHLHFFSPMAAELRNWYVDAFAAQPGELGPFLTAALPGVRLSFSAVADAVDGTQGRVLDRIGFDIQGLAALCDGLRNRGIAVEADDATPPTATALVRDPCGTLIELTEQLQPGDPASPAT